MTKRLRTFLPGLGLAALIATGCVLVSGQFLVQIDLGDVTVDSVLPVQGFYVDLSTNSTYEDHKDDIKSLEDLALVGSVRNTGASSVTLSVYLLDGNPGPQPAGTITSSG